MGDYAIRLAVLKDDPHWIRWVTDTYKTVERLPPASVVDRLAAAMKLPGVIAMVNEVVDQWRDHQATMTSDEIASLSRLDAIARPST
jgi:hypothetical protein